MASKDTTIHTSIPFDAVTLRITQLKGKTEEVRKLMISAGIIDHNNKIQKPYRKDSKYRK